MKLQLDVEVQANGEGKLEIIGGSIAKIGDASAKAAPKLSSLVGGLEGIGKLVAGAGVVAGITALTKSAIDLGDELKTLSDRTGISVENLSVLKAEADQSGTSLESTVHGVQLLSRNMIAAAGGSKQAAQGFQALGISLDQVKKLSPEQMLGVVAQKLGAIQDPAAKTAAAMQLFGRSGAELLPMMDDLSKEGFEGLKKKAEELGLVMSTDAANAADTLNDTIGMLGQQSKVALGGVAQAAVGLAGAFSDDLPAGLGATLNPLNLVSMAFKGVSAILIGLIAAIKSVGATFGGLMDFMTSAIPKLMHGDFSGIWSDFIESGKAADEEVASIFDKTKKKYEALFAGQDTFFGKMTSGVSGGNIVPDGDLRDKLSAHDVKGPRDKSDLAARRESERLFEKMAEEAEKARLEDEKRIATSADIIAKSKEEVEVLQLQRQEAEALGEKERARLDLKIKIAQIDAKEKADNLSTAAMLNKGDITPEAAAQKDWETFQRTLTEKTQAYRDYDDKISDINKAGNEKRLADWKTMVDKVGGIWKEGIGNAIDILAHGGKLKDALDGFVELFAQKWQKSLTDLVSSWVDTLSSWSQGKAPEAGPMAGVVPSKGQTRGAQIGGGILQAGVALYGASQTPAGTRSQNIASQMSVGASIGSLFPGWGTVIGAVVGAIVGAFMPTEKGKNIKVGGAGGHFVITGMESDWGSGKALRQIEAAYHDTSEVMDSILMGVPAAILDQLGQIHPDLSKLNIAGKADGKNWTEELQNFIQFTVPNLVMKAYEPIFDQIFTLGGVAQSRIDEIDRKIEDMDPSKGQEFLRKYIKVLFGIQEQVDFLSKSLSDKMTIADDMATGNPLKQLDDFNKQISRMAGGFGSLDLDQQMTRAQSILDLTEQRYQTELQYLAKIKQLSSDIAKSIDQQIFDIAQTQRKPAEQIDALLERQRGLFAELGNAQTPEEVARITALIQQNAGTLFDLMGKTPEAAQQITDMLNDANKVAQERLKAMADAVEQSDKLLRDVLDSILEFLKGVKDATGGGGTGGGPPGSGGSGGGSGGGDGHGPKNPDIPTAGVEKLDTSAASASAKVDTFGTAVLTWAERFEADNSAAKVEPGAITIPVTVNLNGSTKALIDEVTVQAGARIENRVISRVARKAAQSEGF